MDTERGIPLRNRPGSVPGAWFIASVFIILAILFGLAWWKSRENDAGAEAGRTSFSLTETLGGNDTAGFARATSARPFVFPEDHGAHPDFRNEWWYFTGNLDGPDGQRFGYQLTLFRTALAPSMPERNSEWATRQAWMAHFALTDAEGRTFRAADRFEREAIGLAGAQVRPFRVWIDDWSAGSTRIDDANTALDEGQTRDAPNHDARGIFPLRVVASHEDVAIDLRIDRGRPVVLNGDRGLSRKSPAAGNASFYYAFTRLPTNGTVHARGSDFAVTGLSWLDREWSTSALAEGIRGWDWFALQLDDGSDLMFYRLRRDDGSTDVFSAGTFIDRDGTTTPLASTDVAIAILGEWRSPATGTTYPSGWRLNVPAFDIDLAVTPVLPNQELNLAFRYWEGAVDVRGTRAGSALAGRGYAELTGYSGSS